jgi:hypothetical protein
MIDVQFVVHPEEDKQGAAHPEREPEDVHGGEQFIPDNAPERDYQIVFEHTAGI